ncbi:two-component sensor histidine kinase [Pseudomonas azotoformans]|uniref:histidine kinase n=1 Tax=Pseudomonas azotoformans TaxID=47878 RepID=A0A1V2JNF1_PSEAZ|nr:ATP-binding protein [Pseudomonas azotoformans]OIN47012.1 two-component sensor histidine kinase [Pseudomonas azotoformans]ONH46913.1 two-component sensor histidine kinase [Pseudomonas azotoformans]SDM85581.1 two-component system, OmpR family, sensor histidine kinase AdeS [Pseudomonas azotoformans]
MKKLNGLSRQIIAAMSAVVLCVIALAVIGSYVFYALLWTYWPLSDEQADAWLPANVEWAWMALTTCVSLAVGAFVATRLSRRILMPLNSVAENLRKLADGDLDVQAVAGDQSIGEAAILVDDFNSMAQRLKRMAQEQAFWNAAIAHELRTPLTILRGRLQGLAEGVFEPDTAQFYSLLGQVEGLARMIEDLRVVGLGDSGYLELNVQEADLAAGIEEDVRLFEPSLVAAGFTLQLDLQRRTLRCDPARIRQALLALLDNVRRHATPGNVNVHLSTRDGMHYLRVRDDGPGIDEDLATHLFDAFQRGENSRSRAQGGSGLGLAVVRAIALAHGGAVTCRKMENGGTLFELSWNL